MELPKLGNDSNYPDVVKRIYNSAYIDDIDGDIRFYESFDIFDIPEYKKHSLMLFTHKVKPFEAVKAAMVDIETTGLNPMKDRIKLIGAIDNQGKINIFRGSEIDILESFFDYLYTRNFEILCTYNGFQFDLPFIIDRAELHDVKCPFKYGNDWDGNPITVTHSTAVRFGKPSQYKQINMWDEFGDRVNLIDLYNSVLEWDNVERTLEKYSLKNVPADMGLRKPHDRVELSYQELLWCYDNDMDKAISYLKDDLQDTLLLYNRLMPSLYYQKAWLKWDLQKISTAGQASKWQEILKNAYKQLGDYREPEPSNKLPYQGGFTSGKPGFFRNPGKVDVKSMYPSIMGGYCVGSPTKDPLMLLPGFISELKVDRIKYKESSVQADRDLAASMKPILNSAYGLLNSYQGYNDPISAAMVTAYGRAILAFMARFLRDNGAIIIEEDTDGIFYASPNDDVDTERLFHDLRDALPDIIDIDFELKGALSIYIPPNIKKSKKERKEIGQSKNYIIVFANGKTKATGKFRKRDKYPLQKYFPIELVRLLSLESPEKAKTYYIDTLMKIKRHEIPLGDLTVKRKARVNEKEVFDRGLVDENGMTSYHVTSKPRKNLTPRMKKRTEDVKTADPNDLPSIDFYTGEIAEIYDEIISYYRHSCK